MTYSTLSQCKEELNINSSITLYDSELTDLLSIIDTHINTRLQRFTSLPLQIELQTPLADLESRWVVARYRLRRATPQEQQQYQVMLNQIEQQFQEFLKNNFRQTFAGISSRSDEDARGGIELGEWNQSYR
ncbi:MAG: hypothetical protein JRN52_04630 [Nitrososphaerota archaeon]|nr:hypothetical protein [Nitrososphaerota archaeon]